MNKVVNLKSVKVSCSQCSLSQLCMPRGLSEAEFDTLSSIIKRERPLQKGETLFELGQPFKSLYAIRTGSVKVFLPTNEGEEQIVGFHMPGELLGFDGMSQENHSCSAIALETTSVCELPYNTMHDLCQKLPELNDHFMALMSHEIVDEHAMMLMLARKTAEARMATFLVNISLRFSRRGFSSTEFNLPMSRNDIANYLGLAVETVSRIMTHLQDDGMIHVERRFVSILDMPRLKKLAGLGADETTIASEKA
ncbi:MAG: fumarate/nitrate reduction transcriptional regulator Fnr [Gammaproteobacteria bacterium]